MPVDFQKEGQIVDDDSKWRFLAERFEILAFLEIHFSHVLFPRSSQNACQAHAQRRQHYSFN